MERRRGELKREQDKVDADIQNTRRQLFVADGQQGGGTALKTQGGASLPDNVGTPKQRNIFNKYGRNPYTDDNN